jgi:hypothetical protein
MGFGCSDMRELGCWMIECMDACEVVFIFVLSPEL